MPANRGLVALVALAVLVWSVAFAGGATVAVLSASVDVTTTFETPKELSEVNESSGSGFTVATVPVENETTVAGGNGTSAAANATAPTEQNATVPPTDQNATVPPTDQNATVTSTEQNATVPTDENDSTPATNETETDEDDSVPTDQAGDQSSPSNEETVTNESVPAGNAAVEGSTAPDANDVDAVAVRHPTDPSRSGQGART
ncbi:hypothetical protein [Halorubrum trapanicum]|uniref:hypothetical protein n=1 Tax=Halorubrum trapanicum TaxID=29284 RepID=UPI003C6F0C7C